MITHKKMGRPTDNPKRHEVKIRLDDTNFTILEEYCKKHNISRAEGVRTAIGYLKENP